MMFRNESPVTMNFTQNYDSKNPTCQKHCSCFFFFVVFQIFSGSCLQMVLHCHHCFYQIFCWSRQCTLQVASEIFFCEHSYSHYYLGNLDSQSRAAKRQPDTVNNFATFEHLELIDEGEIFTIRGNRG